MRDRAVVVLVGFYSIFFDRLSEPCLSWRSLVQPFSSSLALLGLIFCCGTSVLGQFEMDALPPPPVMRPLETGSVDELHESSGKSAGNDAVLLKELHSLQQAIDTLRSHNPTEAENKLRSISGMLRKQSRDVAALTGRIDTSPSNYLHRPPGFEEADELIQQLRSVAGEQAARAYAVRLDELRLGLGSDTFDCPSAPSPEIHHISLSRGTVLPNDLRTLENGYLSGYAEIHVSHTARPIILCLSSREPLIWRMKVSENARVLAVVLDSVADQKVIGIDDLFVLDSRKAQRPGQDQLGSADRGQYAATYALAGGSPVTHFAADAWDGSPIELGPANRVWRSAYIANLVEQLTVEISESLRRRQAEELPKLRFAGTFQQCSHGLQPEMYRAEFNLQGPIASTMKPMSDPMLLQTWLVPNDDGQLEFGMTLDARLVTVMGEPHEQRLVPVPLPGGWSSGVTRVTGMAYDSKRQRLLSAIRTRGETMLASLDIHRGTWLRLGSLPAAVIGMDYSAQSDCFWAFVSDYVNADREDSMRLVKLNPGGSIVHDVAVRPALKFPMARYAANDLASHRRNAGALIGSMSQLAFVDGLAVLIGYRESDLPGDVACEIHVIEPDSGKLRYSSVACINGDIATNNTDAVSAARVHRRSIAATFNELDRVETEIRNLREPPLAIDEAAAHLKAARALWDGQNDGAEVARQPRVYVVGRYGSAQPVRVRVTDTSGPVTLVVCGRQAIDWKIEVAEGVDLTEILAAGIVGQTVSRYPSNTKLRYFSGAAGFVVYDSRQQMSMDRVRRRVSQLTGGLDVAAVAAVHQSMGTQIVGPQDGELRMQLIRRELDSVQSVMESRIDRLRDLESRRFHAIHAGPMPSTNDVVGSDSYWNTFTVAGPLIGHSTPIDSQIQFVTQHSESGLLFLLSQGTLTIRDARTGSSKSILLRKEFPDMGQVHAMALDESHDRLILDMATELRTLELQTMTMSTLRTGTRHAYAALAWSASRQQIYAVEQDGAGHGEIRRIHRFNVHGARLGTIELSRAVTRQQSFDPAGLQLIDLDDMLAVIEYRQARTVRLANGHQLGRTSTGRIIVLDVDTGEIVYEANLRPRLAFRAMSESELLANWQRLKEPDPGDGMLLWKMAAGGDSTLQFLRKRLSARSQSPSHAELDVWLDELDHHRYSVRQAAFDQLRSAGSATESFVRERLSAGEMTPEVRERLQMLVANWSLGVPQTSEEMRTMRALEVVARIGTDEAEELLRRWQGEPFDPFLRRHAAQKLEGAEGYQLSPIPVIQFQRQLFVPRRH